MGRSEALVHVSPQTCTKAVHAFREADHALRNAAYVMSEGIPRRCRNGDAFPRPRLALPGGETQTLPAGTQTLPAGTQTLPAGTRTPPGGLPGSGQGKRGSRRPRRYSNLGPAFISSVPHQMQRPGYVWAMTSISTSAPSGSFAAWTVERAGGCPPAWRL